MSSELRTVKADIETFLKAQAPSTWIVADAEKVGTTKSTKIVLSYEQLDISIESVGQELPLGYVWVTFQLVLSAPETDAVKGLKRLTENTAILLQVLDASPDLRWTDATLTRLATGEMAYIIPIALLANNLPSTL